ncbi:hypothetical protein LTR37_013569 [Vermiconidia calcicola]|uniref:Uncharacterized protein n=1 Tax=Vermiconidia calcicola TaxID=1690605 RepID=A0ACC3MWR2_9PEZI|nr:hypothetical protein LTR37_013569 [Vermiconidia calcicola]
MLSIKRPTPTTVLYTVSTRSPATTLAAHASNYIFVLLRILIGCFVATLLLLELQEYSLTHSLVNSDFVVKFHHAVLISSPGQLAALAVSNTPRLWRYTVSAIATWLIFRKGYIEESLLVIRGLGMQTSTTSPSYLWTSNTRFIPTSSVQDIFIHEAFKGFEVKFYLCIVVEGEEDVVVVFPSILPRREILEDVWRGTRACLYEPKT